MWVVCSKCDKWRGIPSDERDAFRDAETVECEDVGVTCDLPQDPRAFEDEVVDDDEGHPSAAREVRAFFHEKEAYMNYTVKRQQAFSSEPFGETGMTWEQATCPCWTRKTI